MTADVVDEVDAAAAGALVMQVAVQAEGLQVALELAAQERGGLAAAGVACLVAAEQDEVVVRALAGYQGGRRRAGVRGGAAVVGLVGLGRGRALGRVGMDEGRHVGGGDVDVCLD